MMAQYGQSITGDVLIVDDNEMNVEVLAAVLERAGHQPRAVRDGVAALEEIEQAPPELILLDINMPKMSGYEVARHLKADATTADIPIIFISALDSADKIVEAFESGGVDYVTKPFKGREVLARVNAQLMLYRQREEIKRMREQDQQRHQMLDKMRKQFVADAAHDLKNPLYLISGYSELLETLPQLENDAEAQMYISAIRNSADRMTTLVQEMLEFIQLEINPELKLETVSLIEFFQQATDMHVLRARHDSISYEIYMPEQDAQITLDRSLIGRVLDNLITNALKYTEPGGTVRVRCWTTERNAYFSVEDTGLGIPEDFLCNLWEPFQRVALEAHMAVDGTGIGLSIVKTIVDRHRGEISVESELGVGSTFTVCLPLQQA